MRRRFGNGKAASLVAVNAHGHGVVFTGSRQREATRRGLGEPAVACCDSVKGGSRVDDVGMGLSFCEFVGALQVWARWVRFWN